VSKAAVWIAKESQVLGSKQVERPKVVVGLSPALFQREGLRKSKPQRSCGYSFGA
jgi:hypothetical protein